MFGGVLGYVIGGLVIGLLARLFKPGRGSHGLDRDDLLGIVGAVARRVDLGDFGLGRAMTWVAAVVAGDRPGSSSRGVRKESKRPACRHDARAAGRASFTGLQALLSHG